MKNLTQTFLNKELKDIKKSEVSDLQDIIRFHRELYYQKESPIISDEEFDHLYKLLVDTEEKYEIDDPQSPTHQVDHLISKQFRKGTHAYRMASLDNTYNAQDLIEFEKRIRNILQREESMKYEVGRMKNRSSNSKLQTPKPGTKKSHVGCLISDVLAYMVELKFDGLGIALTYENGRLTRGLTRGDGTQGEDVTINIMQISSIPKTIPEKKKIEIRGEIVMPIESFEKLNKYRQETGESLFSNPRNAASGSVRQKDWRVTARRELDFFAYSCPDLEISDMRHQIGEKEAPANSKLQTPNYEDLIGQLANWGFHVTPYFKKFIGIDAVITEIEAMGKKPSFPFEIDGLVVKVDDLHLWNILGSTAHHPRSAISYKFPAEYSRTKIESIEHSVGRTGTVTPVANVQAVHIGGAIVRRATLHNYEDMEKKGVMIGDDVWIHRAGEVIPEIISPIIESRDGTQQKIKIPKKCPICDTDLDKDEDKVAHFCPNANCPAKVIGGLEWFVSKHGLDIDGLGPAQVELFMQKGWVTDIASIFDLPDYADQILELEGYKEKSVDNLIASLTSARKQPVWRVISSLGISGVGKRTAKTLAPLFASEEDFIKFGRTSEDLEEVRDIGPETARNIVEYFANNKELLGRLLERVKIEFDNSEFKIQNSKLSGKSFCVTGSFDGYSRDQIHELIENHGGEVRTSVSSKLDYLIAGEKAGSKIKKAQDAGVDILSLQDFLTLLS